MPRVFAQGKPWCGGQGKAQVQSPQGDAGHGQDRGRWTPPAGVILERPTHQVALSRVWHWPKVASSLWLGADPDQDPFCLVRGGGRGRELTTRRAASPPILAPDLTWHNPSPNGHIYRPGSGWPAASCSRIASSSWRWGGQRGSRGAGASAVPNPIPWTSISQDWQGGWNQASAAAHLPLCAGGGPVDQACPPFCPTACLV